MTIHHGDCLAVQAAMDAESVDACVCDPPYHLTGSKGGARGFMGKEWDGGGIAHDPATWAAVLRVLKPGAYLAAFAGTRTYHRMACAAEDAGAVVRDMLCWLYGSGFCKSHNRGELGTALKPSQEPILLAMKPRGGEQAHGPARG